MSDFPETPSFTCNVEVNGVTAEEKVFSLEADEQDRAALAQFLQMPSVVTLRGTVWLSRHGALVRARGEVDASLVRACVATLEPVDENISEKFDVTYTTDVPKFVAGEEVEIDLDAPEPIEGGFLDIGEVLFEQLVLTMDPHPRLENVEVLADPGAGATISAFGALKDLLTKE